MKIRGGVRGAASAWLGLVILQAVVSQGGSGKIAGAFEVIDSLVRRAMDPNVPAIPDRSRPRSGPAPGAYGAPFTPLYPDGPPATGKGSEKRPTAPAPARPSQQSSTAAERSLTLAPPR